MNAILIYFLKVNIAIALFYLFYRLFFTNDTFWKTRRIYLLFIIFVSFVYPFLSIQNWLQSQQPMQALVSKYVLLQEFTVTPEGNTGFLSLENILWLVYGLVVCVLFIRIFMQIISILRVKLNGRTEIIQGIKLVVVDREIAPFSFFGTIYMNPALHSEQEIKQILTHEMTHVMELHSLDVLLSELLCIAFWFNPGTWLLKREIRQNLEFLADNKVVASGFDTKSYQYHLLRLAYQSSDLQLTNKFNVLPLKKRIKMMNQQKTEKSGMLKYLLFVPLAFALIVSSNAGSIISSAKSTFQASKATSAVTILKKETSNEPAAIKDEKNVKSEVPAQKKEIVMIKSINKIDEITVVGYAPKQENQQNQLLPPPPPPPVPSDEKQIFEAVEKMPEFPGGQNGLFKFLIENVKYPVKAQETGTQGRVFVKFVVNEIGKIENTEVIRSVSPELDSEALRIVNAMPQWTPGQQEDKNVSVYYVLPINFRLQGGNKDGDKTSVILEKHPLCIVDGVIVTEAEFTNINPDKIKEINVLKDESAIAMYGDKGKNGVVIITLK